MTLTPRGQIDRTGKIVITDAAFSIWEDGLGGSCDEREAWKRQFRNQVFKRVIQQLNRIGWTVGPWDQAENSKPIANNYRTCSKGDLRAELSVSGRCIEFKMWQGINTPTRPDHGGRYESHKEDVAPYPLRLEMLRTRNRVIKYLCNVFTGYSPEDKRDPKPTDLTALQRIQIRYNECWHIKGDIDKYLASHPHDYKSADGQHIKHGQRVYTTDSKGRWIAGTAYCCINSMVLVVTGKYDLFYKSCGEVHTSPPPNLRTKKNSGLRTQQLHKIMAEAVHSMNYERAKLIRDILFNKHERLWNVFHTGHQLYHRANYCGYTANQTEAGIFRETELYGIGETNELRPIPRVT